MGGIKRRLDDTEENFGRLHKMAVTAFAPPPGKRRQVVELPFVARSPRTWRGEIAPQSARRATAAGSDALRSAVRYENACRRPDGTEAHRDTQHSQSKFGHPGQLESNVSLTKNF